MLDIAVVKRSVFEIFLCFDVGTGDFEQLAGVNERVRKFEKKCRAGRFVTIEKRIQNVDWLRPILGVSSLLLTNFSDPLTCSNVSALVGSSRISSCLPMITDPS